MVQMRRCSDHKKLRDSVDLFNLFQILYLSMIGVYVHHIWFSLTIIRLSGDIEENPGPKCKSNIFYVTGILTVLPHTTILKYAF